MIKERFSRREIVFLIGILLITFVIYLNHFDNPFIFDDMHTIVENESIRSLKNWTDFFTNAETFSSLPANRAYRPIITLKNAIDYAIAGGLDPAYFHYHIFFWFLVLIVLVYMLIKHIYKISFIRSSVIISTALFAAAWFALHTANAETINYICARSDSFSTLCIVASLLLYTHPTAKKYHLYLLTMVIGIWTKQTGVMFFPILLLYILLFEEYQIIQRPFEKFSQKTIRLLKKIAPTAIIATSLFIINQYFLTPASTDSTNYTVTRFEYITTQLYVVTHYLGNFLLPVNLSADPDITIIKPWYSLKILIGIAVIAGMLFTMYKTSKKKESRPVAFGIGWFFIALLPTTLNPLFQIANDHRTFFPFIGLFIAVPWGIALLIQKHNLYQKSKSFKYKLVTIVVLILIGHMYGTFQRNKVWDSNDSLWLDVVIKSPKNARGLMNYGLTHMSRGNYKEALEYFNKALELRPNYYVLHVNLGIVYGALKNYQKADQFFKSAMTLNTTSPLPQYYYADYLFRNRKYEEAKFYLQEVLKKSPNYTKATQLLSKTEKSATEKIRKIEELERSLGDKSNANDYLNVSLSYYQLGMYEKVITVSYKLLEIDPNNAFAYNNICSAYNQLRKWKLGAEACKKAIEIDSSYQLAKNNLRWALDNIKNE